MTNSEKSKAAEELAKQHLERFKAEIAAGKHEGVHETIPDIAQVFAIGLLANPALMHSLITMQMAQKGGIATPGGYIAGPGELQGAVNDIVRMAFVAALQFDVSKRDLDMLDYTACRFLIKEPAKTNPENNGKIIQP